MLKSLTAYLVDGKVRRIPKELEGFHGKFQGNRCFIMGNGPSLNLMDMELLSHEHVWAANKCYFLFDRISWRPAFYVAVDKRVVPDMAESIHHLVNQLPETTFFFPVRFRKRWVLKSNKNVYWYREMPLDETKLPHGMFSLDAARGVSSVRTVTIAALQLAIYMGFNPIYLIGCDTSYSIPSGVLTQEGYSHRLTSSKGSDLNHFDPRYFGKGSKWHEPRVDRMIFQYKQAKQIADSMGVKIYNATVGGQLEVFPRINFGELF